MKRKVIITLECDDGLLGKLETNVLSEPPARKEDPLNFAHIVANSLIKVLSEMKIGIQT